MVVIDEILKKLPTDAQVVSHSYEGANIVIYTKSKKFFEHGEDIIRELVDEFKKRIDLRADSHLLIDAEEAESLIKDKILKHVEVTNIFFEPARSLVVIESKDPGGVIGKNGENLRRIKEETFWSPKVSRESVIPSAITQSIKKVLYEDNAERRKFLDNVGKRIYEIKRSSSTEKWARISFLGGGRQVGRSCFLLQTPESNILLDCGINPASDAQEFPYLSAPEFHIEDLDAVIISHSHLDHSGFVPYLFKYGYTGPIYCTAPTRDVMALLQLDYIDVSHSQQKKPPYSSTEVKQAVKNTITLEFGEVTDIAPDVRITLHNSGHILGSALIHLHIGEGWHNLLYTGDFKCKQTQLLNPAVSTFPRVETLLIESTYGGPENIMAPREESEKQLVDIVKQTLKKKGKVLIPVLGVGRAQEVMVILEKYMKKEKPKVYVDGMVWDITAIHNCYPEFLNDEIRTQIFYKNKDPFLSDMFKQIGSRKEREKALDGGPCVFLATSGMLVGGPSVEYLKELCESEKNSLIFVGYQAEGSMGQKIQKEASEVEIDGELKKIKLKVHTIAGLSGHSDRNELLDYVKKLSPAPRKILVNHGENVRCLSLASTLHKDCKVETVAPRNLDAIRLR